VTPFSIRLRKKGSFLSFPSPGLGTPLLLKPLLRVALREAGACKYVPDPGQREKAGLSADNPAFFV